MKLSPVILSIGAVLLLFGCASGTGSAPTTAPPPPEGDFRGAVWGMGMAEVEETLEDAGAVISRSSDELVCRDTLLKKFPAEALYHFIDGKLRRGEYRRAEPAGIIEYTIFRLVLARKYGPVYSEAAAPEVIEAVWLTPRTEIDLSGDGTGLEGYSFLHPEQSRSAELAKIEVNYYDRDWFARDRKRTAREEASVRESESLYRKLIGDWVEVYPSYRDYMEGAMMLEPGETYVYDPEYYDDF